MKNIIVEKYSEFNPNGVIIEDKASGQQLIQDLKQISQIPILRFAPQNSKFIRFISVLSIFESGKIYLPQNSTWLSEFEAEIFSFPESEHDDQADSMVQFLIWHKNYRKLKPKIRRL